MKLNRKGFSLIELMVVVAIIGILSAIAIPNFQRFQRRARQSEGKAALGALHTAELAFHNEWDQYWGDLIEIGYTPPGGTIVYNAGFTATGGPAIAIGTPMGYPRVPNATTFDLYTYCGGAQCVVAPAGAAGTTGSDPAGAGAIVGSVAPALTGIAATFVASATGFIGGQVMDNWTISQAKVLLNPADGVQ